MKTHKQFLKSTKNTIVKTSSMSSFLTSLIPSGSQTLYGPLTQHWLPTNIVSDAVKTAFVLHFYHFLPVTRVHHYSPHKISKKHLIFQVHYLLWIFLSSSYIFFSSFGVLIVGINSLHFRSIFRIICYQVSNVIQISFFLIKVTFSQLLTFCVLVWVLNCYKFPPVFQHHIHQHTFWSVHLAYLLWFHNINLFLVFHHLLWHVLVIIGSQFCFIFKKHWINYIPNVSWH